MTTQKQNHTDKIVTDSADTGADAGAALPEGAGKPAAEIGGRKGPEPTRYGDWEFNGKCVDF